MFDSTKNNVINWAINDIFVFRSNEDREEDIILVLIWPGSLEWQQVSGGNRCYHMLTLQGLDFSKTLIILSKYTKHVAFRKRNILIKVDFVWAQAETKKI
jgi:hypothetical protein